MYLKDSERKRKKERECFHLLARPKPGAKNCIPISHSDGRGPAPWITLQPFPRCLSRELDGKWSSQDSNEHPHAMPVWQSWLILKRMSKETSFLYEWLSLQCYSTATKVGLSECARVNPSALLLIYVVPCGGICISVCGCIRMCICDKFLQMQLWVYMTGRVIQCRATAMPLGICVCLSVCVSGLAVQAESPLKCKVLYWVKWNTNHMWSWGTVRYKGQVQPSSVRWYLIGASRGDGWPLTSLPLLMLGP